MIEVFCFTLKSNGTVKCPLTRSRQCIEYTLPSCPGHEYPILWVQRSVKNLLVVPVRTGTHDHCAWDLSNRSQTD